MLITVLMHFMYTADFKLLPNKQQSKLVDGNLFYSVNNRYLWYQGVVEEARYVLSLLDSLQGIVLHMQAQNIVPQNVELKVILYNKLLIPLTKKTRASKLLNSIDFCEEFLLTNKPHSYSSYSQGHTLLLY